MGVVINPLWARSRLVALVVIAVATAYPASAHADPIVLFLLRMLRDQAVSSAIESGAAPSRPPARAAAPYGSPQGATDSQRLRDVIDDSFVHLGSQQRETLHANLMNMLDDPRNAAERPALLAEFMTQAAAVREAHRYLSRLSEREMRAIAGEAGVEFSKLPGEQRQQLMQALQHGVPGMPAPLSEMMLAEFRNVAAAR